MKRKIEIIYQFCILILSVLLVFYYFHNNRRNEFPDFYLYSSYLLSSIKTIVGEKLFTKNFKLIVIFTDSDCSACLGILNTLDKYYQNNYLSNNTVIGIFINNDENRSTLNNIINRHGVSFPVFQVKREKFSSFNLIETPAIFLFDSFNRLRFFQPPDPAPGKHFLVLKILESIM